MATTAQDVLARIRTQVKPQLAFRGFGPLVVATILVVAMMLLLPSVAPEQIHERPVGQNSATEPSE